MRRDGFNTDLFRELDIALNELCELCQPRPFSIAQPACMAAAREIVTALKNKGFRYPKEEVKASLIKRGWDEKNASYLLKKLGKNFTE